MSRAYRIRVSESLSRTLKAEDSVSTQLELLEILPAGEMAELLQRELKERGYHECEGAMVREEGDIATIVEPATGTVTVRAKAERDETVTAEQESIGYDDVGPSEKTIRESLRRKMQSELEKSADQRAKKLQNETTKALEAKLVDLQKELNETVNRVTAEALKRKAAQLGQIKSISEDQSTGSLTITVEV